MINGKHGQGTHITKMGADKLAENTTNAPKLFGPICLPKPKNLGFSKKSFLWVSVVRGLIYTGKLSLLKEKIYKSYLVTPIV